MLGVGATELENRESAVPDESGRLKAQGLKPGAFFKATRP